MRKSISTCPGGEDPNAFGGFRTETLKEAGIESVDIAGYERILAALGKKAGQFMQERTKAVD